MWNSVVVTEGLRPIKSSFIVVIFFVDTISSNSDNLFHVVTLTFLLHQI